MEDKYRSDEQGRGEEVIMIDDMSSNEGVTVEHVVTVEDGNGQTVLSVDGSHDSHIDLDQDDDNDQDDNDLHIALEKFVDQSSDSSSAE